MSRDIALSGVVAGFVKIRLVHAQRGSLVLADAVVGTGAGTYWLQPQWLAPSVLNLTGPGSTTLHLEVLGEGGRAAEVQVTFGGDDLVTELEDRSQIYKCEISGPRNLPAFKAGQAKLRADGGFDVRLFHHTTGDYKRLILDSGHVRGSNWNFQGTKELANCSYAYFTSLRQIRSNVDLQRIGMSSGGRLAFQLDQAADGHPDLILKVYREDTKNRRHTVSLWVPAEHIAASHYWKHQVGMSIQYENTHPSIFRIGLAPGGKYYFTGDRAKPTQPDLKRFDYIILGDCTTVEGLAAPYTEEATKQTFQIVDLKNRTVFDYWKEHSNQQLWTPTAAPMTFQ